MGWRRGGRSGFWPGRGPFIHLPRWQRPGWLYGRGACWRILDPKVQSTIQQAQPTTMQPPLVPSFTRKQEQEMLEQQEKVLKVQLDAVSKRLEKLSKQGNIDPQ